MIKFFTLIYSQLKMLSNDISFVDEDIEYVEMCGKFFHTISFLI